MTSGMATIVALLGSLWLGWMLHRIYWHRQRQQLKATIEQLSSERDALQRAAQELEAGLLILRTALGEINAASERLQEDLVLRRRQLNELNDENRRLRAYLERALYKLADTPRDGQSPSGIAHVAQVDDAGDTPLSRRAI